MPESAGKAGAAPTAEDVALAREALLDITTASTIGEPVGSMVGEEGVLTLYFDTTMAGYPGWRWTVSIAHVDGADASVLETELTPGEGALLSPDWVPWSERLADYQEAQAELAAQAAEGDDSDDDDDDDIEDDDDFDDEDVHDDDVLMHSGDLDGVDIDSLDESEGGTGAADSVLPAVGDDEAEQAEGESDDAGPQPPVKARRNQRSKKQQQGDEGE
ncbi:hypothetical protein GCM10022239_08380 [Leifsonia bigeumensis]|uniref:DUF3027 domain-containing protein n=1 Tax=Leifsonella bigeumensis TaxID=433643 RepID=A0ABP7FB99_9MICO